MKNLIAAVTITIALTNSAQAQLYTYDPPSFTTQTIYPFDYTTGTDGSNFTTQRIGPFGYTTGTDAFGNTINCTSQRIGQFLYTNCN